MAITTKILSDTKTHAKVLLTFNNDSATTAAAVDGSGLSGHDDGAKLHIIHINYGLTGSLKLEFIGSSSDIVAIIFSGAGVYYGAVIKNTADNTGATGGDIQGTTASASGYALLTLQKIDMGENS
jgi:hypothetical protein